MRAATIRSLSSHAELGVVDLVVELERVFLHAPREHGHGAQIPDLGEAHTGLRLPVRLRVGGEELHEQIAPARVLDLADHVEEDRHLRLLALGRLVRHALQSENEPVGADAVAERFEELGARVLVGLRERSEERPHRLLVGDLSEADRRFARDLDVAVLHERDERRRPLRVAGSRELGRHQLPDARARIARERGQLVERNHRREDVRVERRALIERLDLREVPRAVLGHDAVEGLGRADVGERPADLRLVTVVGLGQRLDERRLRPALLRRGELEQRLGRRPSNAVVVRRRARRSSMGSRPRRFDPRELGDRRIFAEQRSVVALGPTRATWGLWSVFDRSWIDFRSFEILVDGHLRRIVLDPDDEQARRGQRPRATPTTIAMGLLLPRLKFPSAA